MYMAQGCFLLHGSVLAMAPSDAAREGWVPNSRHCHSGPAPFTPDEDRYVTYTRGRARGRRRRLRHTSAIWAQRHSCAVRQLLNEARKEGNAKGVAHLQAEKLPYAGECINPSADFAGARSLGPSLVSGSVLNTLTQTARGSNRDRTD